jgi:4-phospho-D-threonate 3-dehydrogenase / 4-phospho-D-erythronate 3-dehydrogenase
MSTLPRLAVTLGDPCGIGPELACHLTLELAAELDCSLTLIGDPSLVGPDYTIPVITPYKVDRSKLASAGPSAESGRASYAFLTHAIEMAMRDEIDAIVTLPLSKEALHMGGHNYPGHTEILADKSGTDSFAMLLYGEKLRIIHVTTHVSIKRALDLITQERILEIVGLGNSAISALDGRAARIAICGLNPHSGEEGLFGREEIEIIKPAIVTAREAGIDVCGPFPPDTVFASAMAGKYDLVVAMLHDQGHIAFKTALFDLGQKRRTEGVNVTLGLPFVRTSVDHGTAYDIAGKGKADPGSMLDALRLAARLSRGSLA